MSIVRHHSANKYYSAIGRSVVDGVVAGLFFETLRVVLGGEIHQSFLFGWLIYVLFFAVPLSVFRVLRVLLQGH